MAGPMTVADAAHLPPTVGVAVAAQLLGVSRTTAYALAARDALPVPVLRIGNTYRIPTAPLLTLLGIPALGPAEGPSHPDEAPS
jgi:excisionase family DNA binding protein